MSYADPHGTPAIRLASDAALLFYNKTAPDQYSGVVGFNDTVMNPWPVLYGPFEDEVPVLNLVPAGMTNICAAIQEATSAIVNQGNGGNHNIVLFSDGKHNTGCDPVAAAAVAKDAHNINGPHRWPTEMRRRTSCRISPTQVAARLTLPVESPPRQTNPPRTS